MTELEKALEFNQETKTAVRTIMDELNYGQQQKLYANENVRPILDRYGIQPAKS